MNVEYSNFLLEIHLKSDRNNESDIESIMKHFDGTDKQQIVGIEDCVYTVNLGNEISISGFCEKHIYTNNIYGKHLDKKTSITLTEISKIYDCDIGFTVNNPYEYVTDTFQIEKGTIITNTRTTSLPDKTLEWQVTNY